MSLETMPTAPAAALPTAPTIAPTIGPLMLSTKALRHVRASMCRGKIPYDNKALAKRAARRTKAGGGGDVSPYPCPFCLRFHNGGRHNQGRDSYAELRQSVRDTLEYYHYALP